MHPAEGAAGAAQYEEAYGLNQRTAVNNQLYNGGMQLRKLQGTGAGAQRGDPFYQAGAPGQEGADAGS